MANHAPAEVLGPICQNMTIRELKRARLICQAFNPVAQDYLFTEIVVRSNLGSLRKLSYISRHPVLRHYVHTVLYDGALLSGKYLNFERWLRHGIGMIGENEKGAPVYAKGIGEFRKHLLPAELEYHFSQYCYYIQCQRRILLSTDIKNWFSDAFKSFPNLESIKFTPGSTEFASSLRQGDIFYCPRISWDMLSTVGRETLSEPVTVPGKQERMHMFMAIYEAAHASRVRLKTVETGMIPWVTFGSLEDGSNTYDNMIGRLRHLKLGVLNDPGSTRRSQERDSCARLISKAMMLQTLHLSFDTPWPIPGSELSQLIKFREHWPNLNDLKLGSISTKPSVLENLLSTHSHTLRSLELSDIILVAEDSRNTPGVESWVTIIQFLQKTLQLKNIRLDGRFAAGRLAWITYDNEYLKASNASFVANPPGESLRDQVEDFILHGGVCPLRCPNGEERFTYGDYSWKLIEPRRHYSR